MDPITPAQLRFVHNLLDERELLVTGGRTVDQLKAEAETLDKMTAKRWIDKLLAQPRRRKAQRDPGTVTSEKVTEIGVYQLDGEIYITKPNRTPEKNLYALRLTNAKSDRLTADGKRIAAKFEYAGGVIFRLTPAHRLPAAEAEALALQYSNCIICGRGLEVAESIERGIGPVCYGRLTGPARGLKPDEIVAKRPLEAEPPERETAPVDLPVARQQTAEEAMFDRMEEKMAVQQRERTEDYRVAREKLERDIVLMAASGADTSVQQSALAELREAEQV